MTTRRDLADGVDTWTLVAVQGAGAGAMTADGVVHELPGDLSRHTVLDLIRQWDEVIARIDGWHPAGEGIGDCLLDPPLVYPPKVLCAGANYLKHLAEMGVPPPGDEWTPFFFLKPPTTTVIGPDADIMVDWSDDLNLDWEAELAVVIGRGGKHIAEADALDHVAGYAVVNDVSARGPHHRPNSPAPPFEWDWLASKCGDGFCPIGPGIVPSFLIEDPQNLRLELRVNGELKQREHTSDMISSVAELIAAASTAVTLEPGDVIATGTPSGVGAGAGTFLEPGDVVRVSATSVGSIENTVVAR